MELTDDSQLSSMTCASCGSSFSLVNDETLSHRTGKMHTIGHFELLEQVGASQFGAVWKARDTQLDRVVALKIPRRSQLDVGESEQFFREARAAAHRKLKLQRKFLLAQFLIIPHSKNIGQQA